jgi:hypothetical protein
LDVLALFGALWLCVTPAPGLLGHQEFSFE